MITALYHYTINNSVTPTTTERVRCDILLFDGGMECEPDGKPKHAARQRFRFNGEFVTDIRHDRQYRLDRLDWAIDEGGERREWRGSAHHFYTRMPLGDLVSELFRLGYQQGMTEAARNAPIDPHSVRA